ncbi:MAG: LysM peptidoglycan-binding domain-containing protein [Sulfuricaulis sp.]|nr:LysM peptidoglycan-binding domain-containing protein [Sulfuricaulis sp.]
MSPKPLLGNRFLLLTIALLLTSPDIRADEVQLKPDHPERYTVVKGDTLWDISTRFLKSPWHWPQIWKINQEIKNPHLIYPGDVVLLRWVDGKPVLMVERKGTGLPSLPETTTAPVVERRIDDRTVKLSPKVHSDSLESAIPTIPPNAIAPFLTRPLAVGEGELDQAGYITVGLDDRIALGDSSQFYARGLKGDSSEHYQIFRPGNPIRHPDTGELLAYEALYLGDAKLLEPGDPSKLVVTAVKQEIIPTDRLLVAPKKASLPYYYPHAPKTQTKGRIVSALNSVAEIGPKTVIGISLGTRDGIDEGAVLRVMRHVGTHRDPVTREDYQLPDEESALILVFRTYEKISYALVMTATRPVNLLDVVITP